MANVFIIEPAKITYNQLKEQYIQDIKNKITSRSNRKDKLGQKCKKNYSKKVLVQHYKNKAPFNELKNWFSKLEGMTCNIVFPEIFQIRKFLYGLENTASTGD